MEASRAVAVISEKLVWRTMDARSMIVKENAPEKGELEQS